MKKILKLIGFFLILNLSMSNAQIAWGPNTNAGAGSTNSAIGSGNYFETWLHDGTVIGNRNVINMGTTGCHIIGSNNEITQGSRISNIFGYSNRIVVSHSCTQIGAYNRITNSYGSLAAGYTNSIDNANASAVIGDHCSATGDQSIAAGSNTVASNHHSIALGNRVEASGLNSVAIGAGTSGIAMVNGEDNSFGVGFNSDIPTFYVLPAMGPATTGSVGIGTNQTHGYKLAVNGGILAEKVRVRLYTLWPDFVFEKNHERLTLSELEKFVNEKRHLPGIPSAKEIAKDGYDVQTMDALLLQKVEEMTLYIIEIKKENEQLRDLINQVQTLKQ